MGTVVKDDAGAGMSQDPWVTLNQAALAVGRGHRLVLIAALKGEVRYQIVAGRPVFDRRSLEDLRRRLDADGHGHADDDTD